MKRAFSVVFFTLTAFSAVSQPYESLFGKNSTQWIFEWSNLFGTTQDTIYVQKDTVVNGLTWKKLAAGRNNIFGYYAGSIIREDTMTGKVWYRDLSEFDTTTKLAFDFSLQKGDSFDIKDVWGNPPASQKIVDTVYYENGRKVIGFKYWHSKFHEYTEFIEGVGTNFGIIYKQYWGGVLAHYLLCSYKDGVKTYSNKYYNGICNVHLASSVQEQIVDAGINIYPNPVKNILTINSNPSQHFTVFRLINSNGLTVYSGSFTNTINLTNLPAGIYILQLIKKSGRYYQTRFIKN